MTMPEETKLTSIEEIEAYLREEYPKCFNDDYLPLKIGIHKDIRHTKPPFTQDRLGPVLERYTRNEKYLEKIIQANHPRYNLQGEICGKVTEGQAISMTSFLKSVEKVGGWEKYDKKQKKKIKAREEKAKRKQEELNAQQTIEAQPEPAKEVEKTVKPKKTVETKNKVSPKATKPEEKPKKKAVKADSKVQAKPKKVEPKKPVEPVVKTRKEVRVSLDERREGKSVPTLGKKKLSLKKT